MSCLGGREGMSLEDFGYKYLDKSTTFTPFADFDFLCGMSSL